MEDTEILQSVRDYYGKVITCTSDLKTQTCISTGKVTSCAMRDALADVHCEVAKKYYGCGLAIPDKLEGVRVLDLGSGSGRDCYAISKLVGSQGHVIGIDMTDEQLGVAREYIPYHTDKFGYTQPNVEFLKGYIENLSDAGIREESMDIIISNCVVNLSPDKRAVFSEAYKALKVGGEMYFSDVYCDRDLDVETRKHMDLWVEGFAGPLHWKDLYSLAREVGFSTPRLVSVRPLCVDRQDFKQVTGEAKFASACFRLFKLPEKRRGCCQVIYRGQRSELKLDHQTTFQTGNGLQVDSELATILSCSRFADEFYFQPISETTQEVSGRCPATLITQEVDPFAYLAERQKNGETFTESCTRPKF